MAVAAELVPAALAPGVSGLEALVLAALVPAALVPAAPGQEKAGAAWLPSTPATT